MHRVQFILISRLTGFVDFTALGVVFCFFPLLPPLTLAELEDATPKDFFFL